MVEILTICIIVCLGYTAYELLTATDVDETDETF